MGAAKSVEELSPYAWVDCGADTYVLGSFDGAYVKVRRIDSEWHAHYYARNAAFWKDVAAGLTLNAPYFKRKVLASTDLGHALRGCDTFMNRVLEASNRSPMWLRRQARWRAMPATPKSRALLAQTLTHRCHTLNTPSISPSMTQGSLQRAMIRLRHGGKSLWRSAMKRHNRLHARKASLNVQVGPLPL